MRQKEFCGWGSSPSIWPLLDNQIFTYWLFFTVPIPDWSSIQIPMYLTMRRQAEIWNILSGLDMAEANKRHLRDRNNKILDKTKNIHKLKNICYKFWHWLPPIFGRDCGLNKYLLTYIVFSLSEWQFLCISVQEIRFVWIIVSWQQPKWFQPRISASTYIITLIKITLWC